MDLWEKKRLQFRKIFWNSGKKIEIAIRKGLLII